VKLGDYPQIYKWGIDPLSPGADAYGCVAKMEVIRRIQIPMEGAILREKR